MVRASVSRWGLAVLAAAVAVSGCQCSQDCTELTVTFDSPKDGDTVKAPFDVTIRANDATTGVACKFDSATLTSDNFSADGVVSEVTAQFAGVQLDPGTHTLTAQVNKGSYSKTADITVTVQDNTCTPAVTAVTFPQDTSNDGILNAAELPLGTSLQVQVTAECTAGVQVQIKRNGTVVGGPADFSNGVATVMLVSSQPDVQAGDYDIVAELVKDGAAVGSPFPWTVKIQRALPACQNTTALVQGPRTGGTGTEHLLAATGLTDAGVAEFRLDGTQMMTSTPSMGMVSASWSVPKSGETTYAVELRCTDNFGNVATDTKMVRVDYVPPTAVITQPVANPDGGASAVTDSPTTVTVMTNAEDGSEVCATLSSMSVGCSMVSNGTASINVPFSMDGTFTIEVTVKDLAGNETTTSAVVEAVLQGCGLGWLRPATNPALITASQVTNGNYTFQTQSKPVCVGQNCRMAIQEVFTDGGVGAQTPIGMSTIDSAGRCTIPWMADGGTFLVSAEVDNLSDAGVDSASCDVTVDLLGPAIQSPIVPTGQPYAVINVAQDTQPTTCGAQRLLQFSANVPAGGSVVVCTTQAVDPCTMATRATSPACGAGWYVIPGTVTSPASGFTFTEGTYSIKVVVVGGGTTVASAAVPVFVDVTRPCARRRANPWPQDGADGGMSDGRLNIAELGAAAPRLQFELDPACKDVDTSTLSTTNPVVVRELVSGMPTGAFNLASNATFSSGVYSVDLTQGVANEADYSFFVELTDLAGNKNLYSGMSTDPARYDVRIDKVAPSCDIVFPSATNTLLGLADVPGGQFTVTVGTSADVTTNGVSVTLAGPTTTTRQLTPVAPASQAQTAFSVTGTNAWAVSSTCTDVAGNATPATARNLTIDLDQPTCTIVSPTNSAPYSVNDIQTTLNVTDGEGRLVSCNTNGTPLTPQLLVTSGVATHLLSYPNGTQTVACNLTDLAGNVGSCQVIGVVVNSTSCGFNLTSTQTTPSGFWHNRSNTGNLTATTGTATVTANTPDCGSGKTVTLQRMVPTAGTPVTGMTDTSGNVSFPGVNVVDGERWDVVIDNGAGVMTTRSFRVGLVAPAASGVTIGGAAVTTGSNLYFVAAMGNRNAETGTAGYFADTNAGAAGAQFDVAVNGVTGAFKAGVNGTVQLVFKGSVVTSQNVTTDPQSFTFTSATLPHNDSGAFEVRVLDTAGNTTSVINNPSAIDVIAPGAPTVTQTLTSARAAQVTLQWAPTYDDGTTSSSGGHAGYDVRWTTSSVPSNNAMTNSTDYFGSSSYQDTLSAWSASNINRVLDLPPLNTYYIAVRAKDEVGNYSTHAAPVALANGWTEVTLSAPVASSSFGQTTTVSASLNSDSLQDLIVSAPSEPGGGAVYVYWGGTGFASQPTCAAGCQRLAPSDATSGAFGTDIGVGGNVGDVAAENKPDLIVAQTQSIAPNNGGRVVIYFGSGSTSLSSANSIELRGDSTTRIGFSARIIKDIDGDGLDELAISAPLLTLSSAAQGRVFIYKGRTQAQWATARTSTDPVSMVPYIPVGTTTANYVVDGPASLLAPTGNAFGLNRHGFVSLGDIDGDTRNDFAIPTSRPNINKYRVFSGAAVAMSTGASPLAGENFILEFSQTPTTETTVSNGLGAAAVGGIDVVDSTAPDLVTSFPSAGSVYVYSSPGPMAGSPSPVATIQSQVSFGTMVSVGRIDSGGAVDLLAGLGLTTNNEAWLVYQRSGTFETNLGTAPAFWVSRFQGAIITGGSNTSLGRSNAIGDLDGQGGEDVVLGDDRAGLVKVYR